MSFLNRLKDAFLTDLNVSEQWIQPETVKDLDQIFNKKGGVSAIFKHSSACGTSAFVLKSLEKNLTEFSEKVDFYIIEVRSQRNLSNYISDQTGIRHESPQLILLKEGEALWNASHSAIYPKNVSAQIKKVT